MTKMQTKPLPPATAARLERLLTERQSLQAIIDATVITAREAMDVPPDWTLADLRTGFTAPAQAEEE